MFLWELHCMTANCSNDTALLYATHPGLQIDAMAMILTSTDGPLSQCLLLEFPEVSASHFLKNFFSLYIKSI
jgi:hypothetical protein